MQSWFKYSLAFFGLVLLLTGFIYILGPSSTREAVRSGEMQTGQIIDPNHSLVSYGEPQPATDTESGTTSAAKEKSGDAKAAAATDAKSSQPAKDGAAKVPAPSASPAHKDAHKEH